MADSEKLHAPRRVAVCGGGPAGLMAAETLANAGLHVTIYDRMPSIGRKFLLAGRGGLNLTHSEPLPQFLSRYGVDQPLLSEAIKSFPPARLIAWAEALGQPTFTGSSGRIFPAAMKASPLLRSWLQKLAALGVEFRLRHEWVGWEDDGRLAFEIPEGRVAVDADAAILAFGGASWPQLGSRGDWIEPLRAAQIAVTPLAPANCGFKVEWSDFFRERFAGAPLKDIELRVGGAAARGECMITSEGIEGNAVYTLGPVIRRALHNGPTTAHLDLRPGVSLETLSGQLSGPRNKQSLANVLRKVVKLPPVAIALINEAARWQGIQASSLTAKQLAETIKGVTVRLHSPAPIAKAISTAGGVSFSQIDERFMLAARPGVFVAGEMLDWEAPTGGYLLQACFATGAAAGAGVIGWLNSGRN